MRRITLNDADQVWRRIVANQKEKLGLEYGLWNCENDMPRPDVVIPDWDYSLGVPPAFARQKVPPRPRQPVATKKSPRALTAEDVKDIRIRFA